MPALKYKVGNTYKDLYILERIEYINKRGDSRPKFKCKCSCGLYSIISGTKISHTGYCGIQGRHRKIIDKLHYIELQVSDGSFTKIDKEDLEKCINHCWVKTKHNIKNGGYIHANINGKYIKLHQFVTGFNFVDHINRDTTDNRKINLRLSNTLLNSHNTSANKNFTYNGETNCLMEWSRKLGINRETIRYHYNKGDLKDYIINKTSSLNRLKAG